MYGVHQLNWTWLTEVSVQITNIQCVSYVLCYFLDFVDVFKQQDGGTTKADRDS